MAKRNIKSILNGLSNCVILVDHKGDVVFANKAARLRLLDQDATDTPYPILKLPTCVRLLRKIQNGQEFVQEDCLIQETVPTAFRVTAIRLAPEREKDEFRVALSFEDISHIREAEQMRSDFVANVSHELRSPLTTLYGFIETLQGPARNDPVAQDRFLELMSIEAQRMARLIDDLLSLSKLESQERIEVQESVNVQDLLRRVVELLTPAAQQDGKELDLAITDPLPDVAGQNDQLTQLFVNLIENATKYSRKGAKISVTARLRKKKQQLAIAIEDQGEGIPPEDIPRLTERFYRVDKGRSRNMGGTGLGLAIVKHILIRHKGWLEIESTQGKGSVFTVFLPAKSV